MRVGIGFDVHAFGEGEALIMAGIKIPYHQAFIAHSDGDVVLHAVTDALLGALALGDIGEWFPDNDPQYQGIDSQYLLTQVYQEIKTLGYQVNNLDVVIMAQAPKLSAYKQAMRENIARLIGVEINQVNIKATTTEQLGFIGRKEGIAAQAIVSLVPVLK